MSESQHWNQEEQVREAILDPPLWESITRLSVCLYFSMPRFPPNLKELTINALGSQIQIPPFPPQLEELNIMIHHPISGPPLPPSLRRLTLGYSYTSDKWPQVMPPYLESLEGLHYHTSLPRTLNLASLKSIKMHLPNLVEVPVAQLLYLYSISSFPTSGMAFHDDDENVMWDSAQISAYRSYQNLLKDPVAPEIEELDKIKEGVDFRDRVIAKLKEWCPTLDIAIYDYFLEDCELEFYESNLFHRDDDTKDDDDQDTKDDDERELQYLYIPQKNLMKAVLNRICSSPWRDELVRRLLEELEEAYYHCSTGFFLRMINVLNGFYDDIQINPDLTEEMHHLINRCRFTARGNCGLRRTDLEKLSELSPTVIQKFHESWLREIIGECFEQKVSYEDLLIWTEPIRMVLGLV